VEDFDTGYFEYAEKHPGEFSPAMEDYFDQIEIRGVTEYGHPVPSCFHPYVLSEKQFREIAVHTETMAEILFKVCHLFMVHQEIRDLFEFDPDLLEWMEVKPGYDMPVPVSRYDGYYDPAKNSLVFNEFNADGTSGMNQTNTLEEIFLDNPLGKKMAERFGLGFRDLRDQVLEVLLRNYRKAGGAKTRPNIAIMDFRETASPEEFEGLKKAFSAQGYGTAIVDPRDLTYEKGVLAAGGLPIDILYRRLVTVDLLERREEAGPFIKAYKEGNVCTIGSLRTEVVHSKIIFCLLTDPAYKRFFTPAERNFLADHIPWTRKLTLSDPELLRAVLDEKDSLMLKPHNAYASKGHIVGQDCSQEEWEESVRRLADTCYLVQEKIPAPGKEFITPQGSREFLKINLGTYVFDGKLSGFYTRISKEVVISTLRKGYVVPTLISRD